MATNRWTTTGCLITLLLLCGCGSEAGQGETAEPESATGIGAGYEVEIAHAASLVQERARREDELNSFRDVGVDFRGIGAPASTGRDNSGAGLPADAAMNPSAGAYFGDGRDGYYACRIELLLDENLNGCGLAPLRMRFLEIQDLDVEIQEFMGQEINLVPSNFTPPEAVEEPVESALTTMGEEEEAALRKEAEEAETRKRAAFDAQWKSIMEDLERSMLPHVEGVAIAPGWLQALSPSSSGPGRTWKRASARPNAARLTVGEGEYLPLEAFEASVRIDAFRARVVLDLFFVNDRDKELAGNFKLRLPDGATPYYLAFGQTKLVAPTYTRGVPQTTLAAIREERAEGWEQIKEARLVPRERAAYAFQDTVRRQVDPALMEWSGAGVFETNVFPLLPKQMHRIVVGYEMDLLPEGDELSFELPLPRDVPRTRVNLITNGVRARVSPEAPAMLGRYGWHDPEVDAIRVRAQDPGSVVLQGSDPAIGAHFAVRLAPDLPREPAQARERALFLVDVSLSDTPERFNTWLALMQEILTRNRPALGEFAVAFFNVESFWWRSGMQPNTPENVRALRQFASELALEGATDLEQALRLTREVPGACDVFLLSDGAVTWGEDDLQALSAALGEGRPLFGYTTGAAGTDRRVLRHLAQSSGGAVFSISAEASLEKVAAAHTHRPWQIDGVDLPGSTDRLLRGAPRTLYPGQTLVLAGRGVPEAEAAVTLRLSRGDETRALNLPLADRVDSPLAVSAYGQIAVDQLESLGHEAPREARAYAQHYRVVGRTCSLLMLESEEDYARYEIKPEDDAGAIRESGLRAFLTAFLAQRATKLADPRGRFLRLCEHIDELLNREEPLAEVLAPLLERVTPTAYHVEARPLRCRQRTRDGQGAAYRDACTDQALSYDVVRAEADARVARLGPADGLRALSSLVEDAPGDMALARDVGSAAVAWELPGQAYHILRRVAERRPYELPIYLSIARCLRGMGRTELALLHYELAHATSRTDRRYGDLIQVTTLEHLRLLEEIEGGAGPGELRGFAAERAAALRAALGFTEADLVIVMSWNTDRTDVDLHVTDPSGEECYYQHTKTKQGGRLSQDVTTGYGPELFVLEKAAPGAYRIEAKNFASDAVRTSVRSRVDVTIYEDWGRPSERVTRKSVFLQKVEAKNEVAQIVRK